MFENRHPGYAMGGVLDLVGIAVIPFNFLGSKSYYNPFAGKLHIYYKSKNAYIVAFPVTYTTTIPAKRTYLQA